MRELDNRLMRHIDLLVERYPSLESAKLILQKGWSPRIRNSVLFWQKTCRGHFLQLHWMVIPPCPQPI